jgi:hypothetical protein
VRLEGSFETEAGIAHQETDVAARKRGHDPIRRLWIRKIDRQRLDLPTASVAEVGAQIPQAILAPRDEQQVEAGARQMPRRIAHRSPRMRPLRAPTVRISREVPLLGSSLAPCAGAPGYHPFSPMDRLAQHERRTRCAASRCCG